MAPNSPDFNLMDYYVCAIKSMDVVRAIKSMDVVRAIKSMDVVQLKNRICLVLA